MLIQLLYIIVKGTQIVFAVCLRKNGGIPSGPDPLLISNDLSSRSIVSQEKLREEMIKSLLAVSILCPTTSYGTS